MSEVGFYSPLSPGYPDIARTLDAIFSSNAILLPAANLNRVQDAIDAGTDIFTPNTWLGGSPTDIPQDFAVDDGSTFSSVEIRVPSGATRIFFTVNDSLFGDNADPNGDFGAMITVVPEPSTATLAFFGLILLGLATRLRKGQKSGQTWAGRTHISLARHTSPYSPRVESH